MADNWIIPCNIKIFNIIEYFNENKNVIWKNSFTIKKGDTVYIYIGKPYSEIRYKGFVINDAVEESCLKNHKYLLIPPKSNNYFSKKEKFIEIELIKEFPKGILTLEKLKENGLGQVQIQARVGRKVQNFINQVEESI